MCKKKSELAHDEELSFADIVDLEWKPQRRRALIDSKQLRLDHLEEFNMHVSKMHEIQRYFTETFVCEFYDGRGGTEQELREALKTNEMMKGFPLPVGRTAWIKTEHEKDHKWGEIAHYTSKCYLCMRHANGRVDIIASSATQKAEFDHEKFKDLLDKACKRLAAEKYPALNEAEQRKLLADSDEMAGFMSRARLKKKWESFGAFCSYCFFLKLDEFDQQYRVKAEARAALNATAKQTAHAAAAEQAENEARKEADDHLEEETKVVFENVLRGYVMWRMQQDGYISIEGDGALRVLSIR